MNYPKYSIVIRTLGKAGEKYQATLDSIRNLTLQPKEILVVLPEGYAFPEEKIGTEQFVFSKKGMLQQRLYGAEQTTTEYILFLDDDVSFEPSFAEKMIEPILLGMCDVTIPPQFSMLPPERGIRKLVPALTLSAVPTVFNKNMYLFLPIAYDASYFLEGVSPPASKCVKTASVTQIILYPIAIYL